MRSARRAGRRICGLREAAGRVAGRLGVDISHRSVLVIGLTIYGYYKRILHIPRWVWAVSVRGAGPTRQAILLTNMAIIWWSNGRQTLDQAIKRSQGFDAGWYDRC